MTEQPETPAHQPQTGDQLPHDVAPADGATPPSAELGFQAMANLLPLLQGTDYEKLKASLQASNSHPEVGRHERLLLDGCTRFRCIL
jgi:hypothetical protein